MPACHAGSRRFAMTPGSWVSLSVAGGVTFGEVAFFAPCCQAWQRLGKARHSMACVSLALCMPQLSHDTILMIIEFQPS